VLQNRRSTVRLGDRPTLLVAAALALLTPLACVTKPAPGRSTGSSGAGAASSGSEEAKSLAPGQRLRLGDGWAIRSSAEVHQDGAALSTVGAATTGWIPTQVPATVLAARVAHGDFADPSYGMNLRAIPGTSDYPIGERFALYDTSNANPYKPSWWYRTEFALPRGNSRVWLHFDGINYRANVWLNGKQVANDKEVAGAYRRFAFDVTALAKPGQRNALAVEVSAPGKNDLAPSFIDWNPMPADRNMGLWQDVYVSTTGPVKVEHPFVVSRVPSKQEARLTVGAELVNTTSAAVTATLNGTIGDVHFAETVALAPNEHKAVSLTPETHPELVIAAPRLWWPYQLGPQHLQLLTLTASVDGAVSDRASARFGIREVTMELVEGKWASYRVNGTPLLIRGAGYTSDILLRFSDTRDEQEMALVKDLGLNTIRIEGKLANDHLFDVTDREGILVIPGWECCSAWEYWIPDQQSHGVAPWNEATRAIAAGSLKSQLYRLRARPSVISFVYGSDSHPPPDVERMYLDVIKEARWPMPTQNQASERDPSTLTGPSGFKMSGPYDYVPPAYWYVDHQHGGAFGFNSETGPGAAVPNVDSLKKFLPPDKLWPISEVWNYHLGGDRFGNLDIHTQALEGRYGKATSLEDYALKAQALAYDSERAMFEAYRRNKGNSTGKSTGIVAWMLNSAWPSLLWHLYDYYLAAGGGYYGTKKANELVHIQYSYDDRTVVVVNDSAAPVSGLRATAEVYDLHGKRVFAQDNQRLTVPTERSVIAVKIPASVNPGVTYFVRLQLRDSMNQVVSQNFYWLSKKADVLEWKKTDWWGTPVITHADLTALQSLQKTAATVTATSEATGRDGTIQVTVQNQGTAVAFLLRLQITKGEGGDEVLPTIWSDNYISLLPGEKRELTARFASAALGGARPAVVLSGWNVAKTTIQPQRRVKNAERTGAGNHSG
jgi:exo-1,4-beta-D-glucosaminidase